MRNRIYADGVECKPVTLPARKTVRVRIGMADGTFTEEDIAIMPGETMADALVARFGAENIAEIIRKMNAASEGS